MKKFIAMALVIGSILALFVPAALATDLGVSLSVEETVRALGIMNGDQNGNMNLSKNVTRAEFTKMLVSASSYKDSVSGNSNVSPYKDVKYTHWAAQYIKIAATEGWMTGYTDGTFRPDNTITLEEGASAVLALLGYTSANLSGTYPSAQLSKYSALDLNTNISKTQGQILTREDCMYLFYNLLNAENSQGVAYGTVLGYTVSATGGIDYSSFVGKNLKGPYVVSNNIWSASIPFNIASATVYINGNTAKSSDIHTDDVYYYNADLNTIWVYRNSISGVLTAVSPSTASPTAVTVSGVSYDLESSSAKYDVSDMGTIKVGQTVTLLIGMNGVVSITEARASIAMNGIVAATGTSTFTDQYGGSYAAGTVSVTSTNGVTYEYEYELTYNDNDVADLEKGDLVQVNFKDGKTVIEKLDTESITGEVNAQGTAIDGVSFASNVEIIDSTQFGAAKVIYPSRMAGITLTGNHVLYYETNGIGEITKMILRNVTGDLGTYGIITAKEEASDTESAKALASSTLDNPPTQYKYTYIMGSSTTERTLYNVEYVFSLNRPGAASFTYNEDGDLINVSNLTGKSATVINTLAVKTADDIHTIGEEVIVYLLKNDTYYITNIKAISDLNKYYVSAYYDKSDDMGGRVRVIIAKEK